MSIRRSGVVDESAVCKKDTEGVSAKASVRRSGVLREERSMEEGHRGGKCESVCQEVRGSK